MIHLSGIESTKVHQVWHEVLPLLDEALAHGMGEYTAEILLHNIVEGDNQLWVGHENNEIWYVCVTAIETYPSGYKTCTVIALAGFDVDEWISNVEELDSWCQANGVDAIRIYGRKGWERKLKPYGFEHVYTVLERAVERRH